MNKHTRATRVPSTHACPAHLLIPHLSSQVVACGQVLEPVQAIPVSRSSSAGVVVDHLGMWKGEVRRDQTLGGLWGSKCPGPSWPLGYGGARGRMTDTHPLGYGRG